MRRHLVAVIATTLAAMTACTSDDTPNQGDAADTPSVAVENSGDTHYDAHGPSVTPDPTRDPAAQIEAAEKVLTTWARPTLSYDLWWAGLKPLLNPSGQQAYEFTDPSVIPALKVTGEPRINVDEPGSGDDLARVDFPTNEGTWGVVMLRGPLGEGWLAERIVPPATWDS